MVRVLVVEDDEQVRTMLRMTLEQAGYEIEEAADGVAAGLAQRRRPVDLVITDIVMPEQDGLATIIDLRKNYPVTKIIAISGGGSTSPGCYLEPAKALGADLTFPKPITRERLLGAVRELVGEPE